MANPVYVTLTSTGTSRAVNLDYRVAPFNAYIAVTGSSSGTFTYGVEYTVDDQLYLTNIGSTRSLTWLTDAILPAGQTANGTSGYTYPVAAVRCTVSAISSAIVTFRVLQGGPP